MYPKKLLALCCFLIICTYFLITSFVSIIGDDITEPHLKGKITTTIDSVYSTENTSGHIIRHNLIGRIISNYDISNNMIEKIEYDSLNQIHIKDTYVYDEKGRCVVHNFKMLQVNVFMVIKYSYDDKNKTMQRNACDTNGNIKSYISYIYDRSDKLLKTIHHQKDGSPGVIDTLIYSKNQVLDKAYSDKKVLVQITVNKYDKNGNKISETNYDPNNTLTRSVTYKFGDYDNFGNWQSKIIDEDNSQYSIIERKIIYRQ